MSDGGAEDRRSQKREKEIDISNVFSFERADSPDDYGRAVSTVAVAQVCESVGFEFFKQSALDALSDIAIRFVCDLGKSASRYSNFEGRSECNVFDIVKGLEDLNSTVGFPGAAEGHDSVSRSGVVREIIQFVETSEEIPFAQPIPRFPVSKTRKGVPSFAQMGESPSGNHIPSWLPAFPDPHTYLRSPMWNERKTDPRTDKVEQARQRRKGERSLLSLQQRLLLCNGTTEASISDNHVADVGAEEAGSAPVERPENPFLAPPLPAGAKDISAVAVPSKFAGKEKEKKRGVVFQTFAPIIDAIKNEGSDPMEVDRRVVSDRRPVVHFRLKTGRKILGEKLDVCLKSRSDAKKTTGLVGRTDDKDDKKRRAEVILRNSVKTPKNCPRYKSNWISQRQQTDGLSAQSIGLRLCYKGRASILCNLMSLEEIRGEVRCMFKE